MSETALAALSLVFLLLVLVIGFVKKVNMGYLAMGAALILGRIGGVADKAIIASFNTSLFVSLIGPAFLFSWIYSSKVMIFPGFRISFSSNASLMD